MDEIRQDLHNEKIMKSEKGTQIPKEPQQEGKE